MCTCAIHFILPLRELILNYDGQIIQVKTKVVSLSSCTRIKSKLIWSNKNKRWEINWKLIHCNSWAPYLLILNVRFASLKYLLRNNNTINNTNNNTIQNGEKQMKTFLQFLQNFCGEDDRVCWSRILVLLIIGIFFSINIALKTHNLMIFLRNLW